MTSRAPWPNWQVDDGGELDEIAARETGHDTVLAECLFIMRHIDAATDPHVRVKWEAELVQFEVDMAELCEDWPPPDFDAYLDEIAASTAALLVKDATHDFSDEADQTALVTCEVPVPQAAHPLVAGVEPAVNDPVEPEQESATIDGRTLDVFASPQFAALSARTVKLLVHVAVKASRSGRPFSLKLSELKPFGFNSDWRSAAIEEAMRTGFLDCIEPAQRGDRKAALYWPTWLPRAGATKPRNTWSTITPKAYTRKPRPHRKRSENYRLEQIERRKERAGQFLKKVGT